ncbi:hypothetical protein BRADI_3g50938v3 [Brachypodium distachyon]|uniref:Uncharacterized protein n=1 Tax=Brachypodium distachyon TaxID=15368 RepID=A0A2K2D4H9_BRADI|nr:hypothetical protein BRADI_3g50938v3 [Brachypodium distachyon]
MAGLVIRATPVVQEDVHLCNPDLCHSFRVVLFSPIFLCSDGLVAWPLVAKSGVEMHRKRALKRLQVIKLLDSIRCR